MQDVSWRGTPMCCELYPEADVESGVAVRTKNEPLFGWKSAVIWNYETLWNYDEDCGDYGKYNRRPDNETQTTEDLNAHEVIRGRENTWGNSWLKLNTMTKPENMET